MHILSNPFCNPLFMPVLIRLALLLISGGVGISIASLKAPEHTRNELWARYKSWATMGPLFVISIFTGGIVSLLLVCYVLFQAIKEFSTIAKLPKGFLNTLYALIPFSLALVILRPDLMSKLPIAYLVLFLLMAIKQNKANGISSVALSLFGAVWIILLMMHTPLLVQSGKPLAVIITGFAVALADIGSYCMGKLLHGLGAGKVLPVAENISPHKTLPGYTGAAIGSSFAILLFLPYYANSSIVILLLFALSLAVSGAIGDLTESLVKRSCNVKDSSQVIPGHGGVLDRIDSFLPAIAITALWLPIF